MKLQEHQPNLQGIIRGIPLFNGFQEFVLIDNGGLDDVMEKNLKSPGFAVLIVAPQGYDLPGTHGKQKPGVGSVQVDYSSTVWIRTNPKIKADNDPSRPAWQALEMEQEILEAVMQWSRGRADLGFHLVPGAEPETDYTDKGNFSRLIRFGSRVLFK